ncbi:MAG: glycine dehydrogenase, partial [Candidatus Melainabacteria bacterium HGW-Melainabacteria-1]
MRFIPVSCEQRETMLHVVGARTVDDLFEVIPEDVRLSRPLALPRGMSEIELADELEGLAAS